jgi:hypothetical protein
LAEEQPESRGIRVETESRRVLGKAYVYSMPIFAKTIWPKQLDWSAKGPDACPFAAGTPRKCPLFDSLLHAGYSIFPFPQAW